MGPPGPSGVALAPPSTPRRITEAVGEACAPVPTGVAELDRVLGGGLVPGLGHARRRRAGHGQVHAAAPGAGVAVAAGGRRVLLRLGRGVARQVRARAERLGCARRRPVAPGRAVAARHRRPRRRRWRPTCVVVDSVQTVYDPELRLGPRLGEPGAGRAPSAWSPRPRPGASPSCWSATSPRTGGLAGPRVLEHLVDTVLAFEGDRHHALRLLRAVKHRFGSTDELGLFEMTEAGLVGVPDPSGLFLADRRPGVPGSVVVPDAGRPPAAAGRGAGAGRAERRLRPRPGARPRASTAAAWPCCSPCSSGTRSVDARRSRGLRPGRGRRAGGRAGGRPGLALAVARRRRRAGPLPRGRWWRAARSASAARSARSAASSAGWPRPPGSGFRRAVVPRRRPPMPGDPARRGRAATRRRGHRPPAAAEPVGVVAALTAAWAGAGQRSRPIGRRVRRYGSGAWHPAQRRAHGRARRRGARDGAARGPRPDPARRHGRPDRRRATGPRS